MIQIEQARETSVAGRLLERILDLDFRVQHFSVSDDTLTCEEVQGLKILHMERRRHERELLDRRKQEADQDEVVRQLRARRQ